jgi:hypothetical protein
MITSMRTTVILDDHLARQAKQTAARRGITLSDLIAEALRAALARPPRPVAPFEMVVFGAGEPHVHHEPDDLRAADDDDDRRASGA